MTGMTNSLAVRPNAAVTQPGAALELRSGQTMWTKDQHAALVAMGIPREASSAELGVFLHQCQRTGLDPFTRQIYLIYRMSYENGKPVNKPTMQVGIDGYRLIRDRIAKREGLRVEYEDTVWYGSDGTPYDVWLWDEAPAACRVVVTVDGRRFPSVLRFKEYAQTKKDGSLNKMWTEKAAHMIEKCAEADALRRAFPQDLSGLMLEDAAPLAEDMPAPAPQRVTAEQARARAQQTVTATVVEVTPDVPPAQPATAPASASADPGADAGGTRTYDELLTYIGERLVLLGVTDAREQLRAVSLIAGTQVKSARGLKYEEAVKVADTLDAIDGPGPDGLLADLATAGDPREDGEPGA